MSTAFQQFRTVGVRNVRDTCRVSETTSRVLQLLGLLQSRRVWTGRELAERLGVTGRSVRRDIDRLRELGYPVHASPGQGGGYQLGAGAALPPLLLDGDEAVAVAVCLGLAAGGSVAGIGESALRALSKLDQVMPARLRSQVSTVHEATVTLSSRSEAAVEPKVLMTLARACRDREHVSLRYTALHGAVTQRRVEPYQLVTTGRRWYLLAYDRDRADWRSLRLDRMADLSALGTTFVAREAPDAAAFVGRAISSSPYRYVARVRYRCPHDVVAQHFSPSSATIEPEGPESCLVTTGGDEPERMVLWLASVGRDFEILEPPEVIAAAQRMGQRLAGAASAGDR